ncbi:hypothetical protein EX30DRAFT_180116 [Ascodesmis nigricans]|uniref:Nuclear pore complex NUP2/50/61 domain-containing protein n=1 Tax=Ascodesmis nigricans TaxID=341454 RepID=A0A4S2MKW5_9PEZI|nr:hypothetical protein EX30DRAFT_180116 [Ascodesmis nigricans]
MKRGAESQITKETYDPMNNGFAFGAGGDGSAPPSMADPNTMQKRKIAPLKRRGRGGSVTPGTRGTGQQLPNVFANIGQTNFGAGATGANGAGAAPAFGGFGGGSPGPSTPTGFGNANGGFAFGQQQAAQPAAPAFGTTPAANSFGSNSFSGTTTAPASNGIFSSNQPATTTTSTGFNFGGNSNDKPASSSFTFGQQPAVPSGNMFGQAAATDSKPFAFGAQPEKKPNLPTAPSAPFKFGSTSAAAPEKPLFAPAPAAQSSGFVFGKMTSAPSIFDNKPAETKPAEPASASNFFGKSTATSGGFGQQASTAAPSTGFGFGSQKPAETTSTNATTGFFAPKTDAAASTAPVSNLFAPKTAEPAKPAAPSLFNQTTTQSAAPASTFTGFAGFGQKKEEPAKPAPSLFTPPPATETTIEAPNPFFKAPTEKKEEAPKSLFEKKDGPPKTLFGSDPASDKPLFQPNPPATNMFAPAPTSSTPSLFSKPAAKLADKPVSTFTPPAAGSEKPKFAPAPAAPLFGFKPPQAAAPAAAPVPAPTAAPSLQPPKSQPSSAPFFARPKDAQPSSAEPQRSSPPLPADSRDWSSNQLTEYYNLFALRSLNHSFKEEVAKLDVFADLTPLCITYQKEAAKIRDLITKNQRYKFAELVTGTSLPPGKRSFTDDDDRNGKRRHTSEGI